MWQELAQAGVPELIDSLGQVLGSTQYTDTEKLAYIKDALFNNPGGNLYKYLAGMKTQVANKTAASSEQSKIASERAKWESERASSETKQVLNTTATEMDRSNNTSLGKELGSYLRMPFFKGMPQDDGKGGHAKWKIDLGTGIKQALYRTLEADKGYQSYMKQAWSAKKPDIARIKTYHQTKLDSISAQIVKDVIESRYPNYAKGGSAAGRVAAANAKKEAGAKAAAQSVTSNNPIYVAVKPDNLVRDKAVINGREYSANELDILRITGKGYVRMSNGSLKYVTWKRGN